MIHVSLINNMFRYYGLYSNKYHLQIGLLSMRFFPSFLFSELLWWQVSMLVGKAAKERPISDPRPNVSTQDQIWINIQQHGRIVVDVATFSMLHHLMTFRSVVVVVVCLGAICQTITWYYARVRIDKWITNNNILLPCIHLIVRIPPNAQVCHSIYCTLLHTT